MVSDHLQPIKLSVAPLVLGDPGLLRRTIFSALEDDKLDSENAFTSTIETLTSEITSLHEELVPKSQVSERAS